MKLTAKDLLKQLRTKVCEIAPQEVRAKRDALLIDVREADEFRQGQIPGAKFIPRGFLELRIEEVTPDRDREIILYCAGGSRSLLAAQNLQNLGYTNVLSMKGGFNGWKDSGFEIEIPQVLNDVQRKRYDRHLLIPEIGEAGQLKLLRSKVLLIGAGGLVGALGWV